jgi:CBS domain containing-hemolysin-like protein
MEQGRRNAKLLLEIENHPPRYLNAVYLAVMFAQNGSATLVAIVAERAFAELGITLVSVGFTLIYFVVVEAMSKTFAILHSDSVALALAPFVWVIGRTLWLPTRLLIGIANVLLPGKGLEQGPFVSVEEIRTMAEVGHQEGSIEAHEKQIIHSVFQFGQRTVREIMLPRPDIVAVPLDASLDAAAALIVEHGVTRLPAYREDLDKTEGIVHAKDVLFRLHEGRRDMALSELMLPVRFIPESKRLAELLHEMQHERFHLAMVSDEYGSITGLVTLEDVLEELVGQIDDEYDHEAPDIVTLSDGRYRVNAALPIVDLNDLLSLDLPHVSWNTVGGLVFGMVGRIPDVGTHVELDGFRFTVERVLGRRILTVIVSRLPPELPPDERNV